MPSSAKSSLKPHSIAQPVLALCASAQWREADALVTQTIKAHPDDATPYALVAHIIMRQGNMQAARWLVHKAQGLSPANEQARIEDIGVDFYEGRFEQAWRKLSPDLLAQAPAGHPIHLAAAYLCCQFGDSTLYKSLAIAPPPGFEPLPKLLEAYISDGVAETGWEVFPLVSGHIGKGDRYMACLAARFAELFFLAEANSFAALGLFHLSAGHYENAARNFHEATFRQSSYDFHVSLYQFYLFCRQQRFAEAIPLGEQLQKTGLLAPKDQALLLEAMLRFGMDPQLVAQRLLPLAQNAEPALIVLRLRLRLKNGSLSRAQALEALKPYVENKSCPAPYLYAYAELLEETDAPAAKRLAAKALALDSLYPDAEHWDNQQAQATLNFEYAGLFIPREHEGGALPTGTQLELLEILFSTPPEKLAARWRTFAEDHSLYTLEAGSARLLPFIYKTLSQTLPEKNIAEADLLKGIWKKSYFENALRMKTTHTVLQQLAAQGIEATLLKGMANAVELYGDLGSRPMSDVDILLHPSNLQAAHETLTAQGWTTKEAPQEDRTRFSYGITYRHPHGGMLDVHWRPCSDFTADFYDPADVASDAKVDLLGHAYPALSPTLNLLFTILHGVKWNHLPPVRWVADALLILRRHREEIDWQHIQRLVEKYVCVEPLAVGLQFLNRFDANVLPPLPPGLQKAAQANYDNDVLMRLRLGPKNSLSSFEEAQASIEQFHKRFTFAENDTLLICGGADPAAMKAECARHGISWLPHFSVKALLAAAKGRKPPFNLIAFDANLSCNYQCLHVAGKTLDLRPITDQ